MRRAGHPSTRHRGGGDARTGEGRAQRQRDDPGVADLDCFGFLCCLLRDRLVCFDQLKRQTSSAITACLAAKLLHQQQRKPSLTIPTPSLGHRGNTLFFRAVSSILSQRLLHKKGGYKSSVHSFTLDQYCTILPILDQYEFLCEMSQYTRIRVRVRVEIGLINQKLLYNARSRILYRLSTTYTVIGTSADGFLRFPSGEISAASY